LIHRIYAGPKQNQVSFLDEQCDIKLVESIPEGLVYPNSTNIPKNPSTFDAFTKLLDITGSTLELASSYWTLRGADINHEDPTAWEGEEIFRRIHEIATSRNVKIKIAQDLPKKSQPNKDTEDLSKVELFNVFTYDYKIVIFI
jgi:phospholipase D3/4